MEQVPQVTVATRVVWERPERPQRNAKHREVVVGVSYGVTGATCTSRRDVQHQLQKIATCHARICHKGAVNELAELAHSTNNLPRRQCQGRVSAALCRSGDRYRVPVRSLLLRLDFTMLDVMRTSRTETEDGGGFPWLPMRRTGSGGADGEQDFLWRSRCAERVELRRACAASRLPVPAETTVVENSNSNRRICNTGSPGTTMQTRNYDAKALKEFSAGRLHSLCGAVAAQRSKKAGAVHQIRLIDHAFARNSQVQIFSSYCLRIVAFPGGNRNSSRPVAIERGRACRSCVSQTRHV